MIKTKMSHLLFASIMVLGVNLVTATSASATLLGVGDTVSVSFDCASGSPCGGGNAPFDLSTELSMTLTSAPVFDGSNYLWDFNISILNDSAGQEYVDAIAFDVSPDATGATFLDDGTLNWNVYTQDKLAGSHVFDLCFTDSNNSQCNGGAGGTGLGMGDSDSMILQIATASDGGGMLDLSNFRIKWTGDYGSFETGGSHSVPEPSAAALMGLGLLMMGVVSLRRKKA